MELSDEYIDLRELITMSVILQRLKRWDESLPSIRNHYATDY